MTEDFVDTNVGPVVGRVLGTDDATPLEFWVAVAPGQHVQLDDVLALDRILPTGEKLSLYGIVGQVRARHEGARFQSDVFLISDGLLPAEVSEAAMVQITRVVPEIFVPPLPGTEVRRAVGAERDAALDHEWAACGFHAGSPRKAPLKRNTACRLNEAGCENGG